MMRASKKLTCIVGTLIGSMVLLVASHRQLLPYALTWLDIGEQPRKADAIFVLLGGDDVRPFAAAALYKTGFAPRILVSITRPSTSKYTRPKHLLFQDVMVKRGVPTSAIHFIGDPVHNTMKESEALKTYLEDHPNFEILVITTHFHTRRTRWSLRRTLGQDANRLHFVSAAHDGFDEHNWWVFARGFELVLMEYIKLLGYWVLYGSFTWFAGLTLGLAIACWIWRRARRSVEVAKIPGDTARVA